MQVATSHRIAHATFLERLKSIEPMVEFSRRSAAKGQSPAMQMPDGRTVRTLEEMASYIAEQRGIHLSAVWKRYSRYKKYDFFGMAHVRSDCGKSLFFAKHGAIASYLKRMRLQGKSAVAILGLLQCKFPAKRPTSTRCAPI